jgi:hypothetical protein
MKRSPNNPYSKNLKWRKTAATSKKRAVVNRDRRARVGLKIKANL